MNIGVTKEAPHNFTYNLTNGNIFILAKHMFFITDFTEQDKSKP